MILAIDWRLVALAVFRCNSRLRAVSVRSYSIVVDVGKREFPAAKAEPAAVFSRINSENSEDD
jgi:hypothetical protein